MQCLDTLALDKCEQPSKPNTITLICKCTLNNLHVTNVNAPNPTVLDTGYFLTITSLVHLRGGCSQPFCPWTTSMHHGKVKFFALTCIDTTTNLVKLTRIFEKLIIHIATCFEQAWLS